MRKFTAVAVAALMVLAFLALPVSAADTVEIRGPVFEGADFDAIFTAYGDPLVVDATNFAGFFYDLDDDVSTETLTIKEVGDTNTDGREIGEGCLVYRTTIEETGYAYDDWGNFPIEGFFAEDYVPVLNTTPDKLAKLVLDSDDKYTVRTGELLDLGSGYAIEAKQVDVDGNKVWIEFTKDGEYIDDEVVDVDEGAATWDVDLDDIEDEDDVIVLKVHVNQVFQGAEDSIAQIDGLWLIDYENVLVIEDDDEFGALDDLTIDDADEGDGYGIEITNEDSITLSKDSTEDIAEGMEFKVADDDTLRFYVFVERSEPGTYEIRGTANVAAWDASSFAALYYDLDDDVSTESITVQALDGRKIEDTDFWYNTTIEETGYAYDDWGNFAIEALFAQAYVPIINDTPDKLAKLVIDDDDKYTIRTGELLDLGEGYAIEAKQVDVDGNKVWIEFTADGEYVDDEVVDVDAGAATWDVDLDDIADEDDVVVLKVHVNQVFQGAEDSIAQIDGLWLIDYANVVVVEDDDEFGIFDDITIDDSDDGDGYGLYMNNEDSITLSQDSTKDVAEGIQIKVADSDALRYYPFIEVTIGGEVAEEPAEEPAVEEPAEEPAVEEPAEEPAVEEPAEEPAAEEPAAEEPAEPAPEQKSPGFELAFAVAGLLSVVYLVRRN